MVVAEMGIVEIFSEAIGLSIGDMTLALIVFMIAVALIMWIARMPLGAVFVVGFPLLGAIIFDGASDFVVSFYVLGAIFVGALVFLAIGEVLKKW